MSAAAGLHAPGTATTPGLWTRLRSTTVVVVVGVLLAGLAVMFANAQSAERVAAEGQAGIRAEAVLSTTAVARNRAVQALVIASAERAGSATEQQVTEAAAAAQSAVAVVDERMAQLGALLPGGDAGAIRAAAADFATAVTETTDLIASGEIAAADAAVAGTLDPAYEALSELLVAERDRRLEQITAAQSDSGRVADAARFLVAFIVPLIAILLFWRSARRRQQALLLREELERQRAVGRTKDEFIANLSHELRTPLTGIYGFAMAMLDTGAEDPFTAEMAGIIAGESAELSRMVDDLLTAAAADNKGLAITIEPTEVEPEVAEIVAPLGALGRAPELELEPAIVAVDRLRLRQVLRNLVSNADKHGGTTVRVGGRVEGEWYVFEVSDDGPGVPSHVADRMFRRFVHEGEQPLLTGSVGLGLSIADLLTRSMSGRIDYERRGGWTVFAVRFPLLGTPAVAGAKAAPVPVAAAPAQPNGSGRASPIQAAVDAMCARQVAGGDGGR